MRFHAQKRILSLADKNSFREWDTDTKWDNPLGDNIYEKKLVDTTAKLFTLL
jgi:acetyl-CoA carboxylase beta subunit